MPWSGYKKISKSSPFLVYTYSLEMSPCRAGTRYNLASGRTIFAVVMFIPVLNVITMRLFVATGDQPRLVSL